MGEQTTSSTTDGRSRIRAGRGRGVILAALTTALFSLSAGAAAASPVETPPSPQHLPRVSLSESVVETACDVLGTAGSSVPATGVSPESACQNVNGWQ